MLKRILSAAFTSVGVLVALGEQETVSIGSARFHIPSGWRESKKQEDQITFRSPNGLEQATISLIRPGQAASFEDFQNLCEKRITAPLAKPLDIARKGGDARERLESVAIQSILGADHVPPFNSVFYYAVWFKGGFERRLCVVLMDGTVLRPIQSPPPRVDPENIR